MSEMLDCIVPTYGNRVQPAAPIWGRPPPYIRAWAEMLDPEAIRGIGVAPECVSCVVAYKAEHDAWSRRSAFKLGAAVVVGSAAAGAAGYALFRKKGDAVPGVVGAVGSAALGALASLVAGYAALKGSEP